MTHVHVNGCLCLAVVVEHLLPVAQQDAHLEGGGEGRGGGGREGGRGGGEGGREGGSEKGITEKGITCLAPDQPSF